MKLPGRTYFASKQQRPQESINMNRSSFMIRNSILNTLIVIGGIFYSCTSTLAWYSSDNVDHYCKDLIAELDKNAPQISERATNCVSYFAGVGDALMDATPVTHSKCASDRYMNLDDLNNAQIFDAYLTAHPEKKGDFASRIIREAIEDYCKGKP